MNQLDALFESSNTVLCYMLRNPWRDDLAPCAFSRTDIIQDLQNNSWTHSTHQDDLRRPLPEDVFSPKSQYTNWERV